MSRYVHFASRLTGWNAIKSRVEQLGLSMRSVETYRSRMAEKLGFQSRVDLVRYALETGLLKSGDPV